MLAHSEAQGAFLTSWESAREVCNEKKQQMVREFACVHCSPLHVLVCGHADRVCSACVLGERDAR